MVERSAPEGLSDSLRELASTMQLDGSETMRLDAALRPAEISLADSLPQLNMSTDRDSELAVMHVLGEGGMGQVRLAHQKALRRDVAVKMVSPARRSPQIASLLMQEGIITGQLEHPNIVPVHMLGVDAQQRPIIVMKRVEGVPWSQLDGSGIELDAWSGDRTIKHLEVFLDVCNAVAFAHARGYVHRDIKPANVMVGAFGEVYLLDWGISTRIGTRAFAHLPEGTSGMPLGTPLYMAPEMCRSHGVIDERTDVFLLGATLHRVLTGSFRHQGSDLVKVLMAAARSAPFPYKGEIADELAALCNKATANRPEDRYASVRELRDGVKNYLRHKGSIELAQEAQTLLTEMESHVGADGDRADARRMFTECRFAFMRALKGYADNKAARTGLQRCLETMTRIEIESGQLDAAQALLEQMPDSNVALQSDLERARVNRDAADAQVASLRMLAHELDPTVSKKQKTYLAIALCFVVVGNLSTVLSDKPILELSPIGAIKAMPVYFFLYIVVAAIFRKSLFGTAQNRRVMLMIGLAIVGTTLNRALAMVAEPPFEYMIGVDLFLLALLAGMSAGAVDRVFTAPAVIWLFGFVAVVFLPDMPMVPYGISQLGGLIALAAGFYHRKAKAGDT